MDLSRIPPPVMNWKSSNLPEQWEKFKLHVELIFSGPLKDKPEEDKVSYLLLWIGEEGRQIYKTWPPFAEGSGDEKKLEPHFKRFKAHVQPKLNPIFARYRFNNEIQGSDTIDNFVTRLRIRAQDCEFKEKDNMIRDRIVFGCSSPRVREKLINEGDKLTMDKAIQVVQNFEYCQQQLSSMTISSGTNVDAVNRRSYGAKPPATGQPGASKQGQTGTRRNQKQKNDTCGNCGTVHAKNKCPAYGKICHACGKKNHYIKMCRSSKTVHEIHEPYELYNRNLSGLNRDSSDKDYFIDTVDTVSASLVSSSPDRAFATLQIGPGRKSLSFKIDTGSAANILPYSHFSQLKVKHPLEASEQKLT